MKKKNLIVLLLLPFIISTLCIVTVNITYNAIDVDISAIAWNYSDVFGFKIADGRKQLNASGVNRNNYSLAEGNELVWKVSDENIATIERDDKGNYFIVPKIAGEVIVTCSTQKGNVSRQFRAVIYENAAILVQSAVGGSQTNIDNTIYYGEYDLKKGEKQKAVIAMSVTTLPSELVSNVTCATEGNVSFDMQSKSVAVEGAGDAKLTFSCEGAEDFVFAFNVVENGVNVYSYSDLLYCTNNSQTGGEIAVLRKHFESVESAYYINGSNLTPVANNVACFGNYNAKDKSFNFKNEVYFFETNYNSNYIKQWNDFASQSNGKYSKISSTIYVGLRVQKDFYGNGYTINFHNLAYPYSKETGTSGQSIPVLTSANIFRGPLPFYTLGDPNDLPLVSALGQDNIGMYVDGNGITVNDISLKNCNNVDRLANLDTVGTVLEVHGNNNTVKNSQLMNGKNIVRAYSSMNFTLKNCLILNSRNFSFISGSNEFVPVDGSVTADLYDANGNKSNYKIDDYLAEKGQGDELLNDYLLGNTAQSSQSKEMFKNALLALQNALNSASKSIQNDFKGSSVIEDCLFENSGISAISVESLFNGPFLYTAVPSQITNTFSGFDINGKPIVPYTPTKVSGLSYPVKIDIKGDTRFYDFKTKTQMELDGLISENISSIANTLLPEANINISIDDIFPLKNMAFQTAKDYSCLYLKDGEQYINVPIAYYGGGLNLSVVSFDGIENKNKISQKVNIDLLSTYVNLTGGNGSIDMNYMQSIMLKTVPTVIGYEPFKFHFIKSGYLFGEHATRDILQNNLTIAGE